MQVDDFKKVLGQDLPGLMEAANKLEKNISPILAKIGAHRSEIDPALMKKYDEALEDLEKAKQKMKTNGNFNSK